MAYSSACVEDAEFAMAYYKRGKCYLMMHDYKRALYDFSAAILNEQKGSSKYQVSTKEGGLAQYYMCAGQCNYYLGQYEEALAHYQIAIRAEDKDGKDQQLLSQIYYNKGLANASLMNYSEAIRDYEKALEGSENTKNFYARFQLGVT